MREGKDRLVLNLVVAGIVVVGVSSSVSPWLATLYSWIAVGLIVLGVIALGIGVAVKIPDWALSREARESWAQNGEAARVLAAKHAAHPEVAKELAARLLAEKLARQQGTVQLPPTPTAG